MDRCPVCDNLLWPWTGIIIHDGKPMHKPCWYIYSMFEMITKLWMKDL